MNPINTTTTIERNSGVYESIDGEIHFYPTPYNAEVFIATAITQQQQMLQYFLQSTNTLNPYAIPYDYSNNAVLNTKITTTDHDTNTSDNNSNMQFNTNHLNNNTNINSITAQQKNQRLSSSPPTISNQ